MEVDGAPIADFNLSEGEKLRVVKVGTRLETVRKKVSKKQTTSSARGGAVTQSQVSLRASQGLEPPCAAD